MWHVIAGRLIVAQMTQSRKQFDRNDIERLRMWGAMVGIEVKFG